MPPEPIPNTPSVGDGTDFGSQRYGDAAPVHIFNVVDTGNVNLTVTSVTLSPGFVLAAGTTFPVNITANASYNALGPIGIQLDTSMLGTHNGVISFNYSYNDGISTVTGSYTINVTGTVHPMIPVIKGITPDSSGDNGGIPNGTTVANTFTLNGVAAPLTTITVFRTDVNNATPVQIGTVTSLADGTWSIKNAFTTNLALGV